MSDQLIQSNQIADSAITESKLADDSVSVSKIIDAAITAAKLADGCVVEEKVADNAISNSKIIDAAITRSKLNDDVHLFYNNSNPATDPVIKFNANNIQILTNKNGREIAGFGEDLCFFNEDLEARGKVLDIVKRAYTLRSKGTKTAILHLAPITSCRVVLVSSENNFLQTVELKIQRNNSNTIVILRNSYEMHRHSNDLAFSADQNGNVYVEKSKYNTGRAVRIHRIEQQKGTVTILDGSLNVAGEGIDESYLTHTPFRIASESISYSGRMEIIGDGVFGPNYKIKVGSGYTSLEGNELSFTSKNVNYLSYNPLGSLHIRSGITDVLAFDSNMNISFFNNSKLHSNNFVSGWSGSGWQIDRGLSVANESSFEVDNLTIRNTLNAYELLINKIRAVEGGQVISAAAGKVKSINSNVYTLEDADDDGTCSFDVDDIVLVQKVRLDGTTITKRIVKKVTAVSGVRITLGTLADAPTATGNIEIGDAIVQIGSTSKASRQGSIYLTAHDSGSPFIRVMDGVTSWADWTSASKIKAQLGNLSGYTFNGNALSGYGLVSENVYLSGVINMTNKADYKLSEFNDDLNYDVTNYEDYRIANNLTEGNITTISKPIGGSLSLNGDQTGAIKITLPQTWSNTMISGEVSIYLYSQKHSFVLRFGGYTYPSGERWYNTFAQIIGNTESNNRVRFGHDGDKCCVVIGDAASRWQYPKIAIKNIKVGFRNYGIDKWKDGWNVSLETDISGITFTADFPDALLDAKSILNQGVLATRDDVDWDSHIGNIPNTLQAPSGDGLYLSATNMGYYKSGVWKTYIASDGKFYFAGQDSNNYISYNGVELLVSGKLTISSQNSINTNNIANGKGWTDDTKANSAYSLAGTADNKADNAQSTANNANSTANTALTNANNAQTKANSAYNLAGSKQRIFYQNSHPTSGMHANDLWFDTNNNYKQYRYNGSNWVSITPNYDINTTTIIGNTVTTGYINARNVTAASVKSSWVYAGVLIGNVFKTRNSGQRITINESANRIRFYDDSGNVGSVCGDDGRIFFDANKVGVEKDFEIGDAGGNFGGWLKFYNGTFSPITVRSVRMRCKSNSNELEFYGSLDVSGNIKESGHRLQPMGKKNHNMTNGTSINVSGVSLVLVNGNDDQHWTITSLSGAVIGQKVTLLRSDNNGTPLYVNDNSTFRIASTMSFGRYDTLTLIWSGSNWYEVSRSNN